MNRLTKDLNTPHDDTTYADVVIDAIDRENIVLSKLKHYEDIEEELGIDLITLFKALKNGIYKKGRNNLKGLILYSKMPMFSFYHKTIDAELIEDYGKTWALTKEELKE